MKEIGKKLLMISLIVCFCIISCKKESSTAREKRQNEVKERYFNFQEKGWKSLSNSQKIDDIHYTATEVPLDYYILNSQGTKDVLVTDSISKANKTERIIEFEFLHDEEKNLLESNLLSMDYESAVKYMSFNIYKDFFLVSAQKDTIRCEGVLFQSAYKVSPSSKLLLFFSGVAPNRPVQLVYDDKLFGKGLVKFSFKENITKIVL